MLTSEQSNSCESSQSPSSKPEEKCDFELPEIGPDDGPMDWPHPSWTAQLAHAGFVISSLSPADFAERCNEMYAEPFVLH